MTGHDPHPSALPLRVYLILSTAVAMAAVIVAVVRENARGETPTPLATTSRPTLPDAAIAAEADVFRTTARILALGPESPRQRSAHPRTLVSFRFLRAYPGAPPRIPHALTEDEFRTGACGECHRAGGYSIRFTAYVPITPHPELGECLQCHAGEDEVMGVGSAMTDPNVRCHLCHGASGRIRPEAHLAWTASGWVDLDRVTPDGTPPSIPHDRLLRGNCIACHSGPAAVAEIRMKHSGRANCRQCHVEVEPDAEQFERPGERAPRISGGAQ